MTEPSKTPLTDAVDDGVHDQRIFILARQLELANASLRAEIAEARKKWEWVTPILSGDDDPLTNSRTLELAAGLMRNETLDTIVSNAIRAIAGEGK